MASPLGEAKKGACEVSAPPSETDGVGEGVRVPILRAGAVALVPRPAA